MKQQSQRCFHQDHVVQSAIRQSVSNLVCMRMIGDLRWQVVYRIGASSECWSCIGASTWRGFGGVWSELRSSWYCWALHRSVCRSVGYCRSNKQYSRIGSRVNRYCRSCDDNTIESKL
jgi:hypothetical protein